MSVARGWATDAALGVRLAVGGGRTAMTRLTLSSVGVAVAVAVLLVMASIGTMNGNRSERRDTATPYDQAVAGVSPTYYFSNPTEFRGKPVDVHFVMGTAPDSPKPAGLPELPKDGEMYASPALVELLSSDEGELLRPRFPEKIVGTLDKDLVRMPGDLVAWLGASDVPVDELYVTPVYRFGWSQPVSDLNLGLLMLLLIGGIVVLLPLLTFIASTSRIAGAERDRRLSALRLVGAGSRQVRRIAAAESLVSAVIGMVVGTGLFLVARQFAEQVEVMGERSYVSDVVPNPFLVVVIVLLVPGLSVATALFALRRTIIEPLGVVRESRPVRRRAGWRFAVVAAGVALMVTQFGLRRGSTGWAVVVAAGAVLLLVGVPVLLPWLVERVAGRIRGGPPSWVLAVRRLQLDSGTSARVVGGVAVVLAGAIAAQTVLLSLGGSLLFPDTAGNDRPATVEISTAAPEPEGMLRDVTRADGVRAAHLMRYTSAYEPGVPDGVHGMVVLDCAAMRELAGVRDCRDGDVFEMARGHSGIVAPAPGTVLEFREHLTKAGEPWDETNYEVIGHWTVPAAKKITRTDQSRGYPTWLVTPSALNGQPFENQFATVTAQVGKDLTSNQLEGIRNAVAGYRGQTHLYTTNGPELTADQQSYRTIRGALSAAAIFTLLVACVGLLVLAVEHIRERRRPLAVLAASGVPTGVLGRSLVWQTALPIVLGVVVALLTGLGLAAFVMDLADEPLIIDWPGVVLMCAGASVMTVLMSVLTLPFLRRATRLTTIRTE